MELFKNLKSKNVRNKRVARGGKRGVTSGRGTKGQGSRSGHKLRPAMRDLLIRIPKLRGYRNKPVYPKLPVINAGDLMKSEETSFSKNNLGWVKILGGGEVNKAISIKGLLVSKSAKEKIEKAGGKVE